MIEIKNIVKTYHPKKGGAVIALNNVSLKFPEKGLVFILGKSGSGKSTLLNVMGGLDSADSGEIIIKGKSSKEFSTEDFDSYRNTYLGFIFQEYNILEDFNVGTNIAIALKIQGEKVTNEKLNEILNEVDLSGYGKRKTNELSGGQKQRVAIARALVKNPEIIMADEPTGALDSNTGIQVFNTLKKLSKDKLVIVVSHDREFAEEYGDRVIELKDGVVISDIEKHYIDAEVENGGIKNYNGKLIHFPKGYQLTSNDIIRINSYLESDEAFLSLDNKVNLNVKSASHICEDGRMETFATTDESAIKSLTQAPFKLIKSRLPIKESFKIGISSMKTKPIRLVTTILLCFICFTLFGIVDSFAAYNSKTAIVNSIYYSDIKYTTFKKMVEVDNYGEEYFLEKSLSDSDIEHLRSKIGIDFLPVLSEKSNDSLYMGSSISSSFLKEAKSIIYSGNVTGIVEITDSTIKKHNLELEAGRLPSNITEIAISDYVFDCFKKWGYLHYNLDGLPDESKNIAAANIIDGQDFIETNPNILINGDTLYGIFKIVGIVKTGYAYSRYEAIDKNTSNDDALNYYMLLNQFSSEHNSSFSGMLFGCDKFINEFLKYRGLGGIIPNKAILDFEEINGKIYNTYLGYNYTNYFTTNDYSDIVYLGNKSNLSGNGIALGINTLINGLKNIYYNDDIIQKKLKDLIIDKTKKEEIINTISPLLKEAKIKMICGGIISPYLNKMVSIDGFFFEDEIINGNYIGISNELANLIKSAPVGKYSMAISGELLSKHNLEKVVAFSMQNENGVKYSLVNYVITAENMIGSTIKTIAKILLYVGIGIFVFAIILFTTYISASVTYKKREIGILRAIGARSSDVYLIFLNEALCISFIVFSLAVIGSSISVSMTNSSLRTSYGLPISLLNYGFREVGIILLGCILTALLASFVPVLRIAKKKPVDAINNK